jgi:tetratricopeptide (TPR) repeat protein
MVAKSRYDFLGGYEHDTKGGVLHVANHHISPGKKQWTWGNGKFGRAWDRNLTDGDEAYVELMCGVYTDNQPDFSWIMPHEEKSFSQYFFPYHELGVVKNATREASINIDAGTDFFELRILTTSILNDCKIAVYKGDTVIFEDHYDASPTKIYSKKIKPDTDYNFKELSFKVLDNDGNELVSWAPEVSNINDIPLPAIAPMEPEKVESIEELFLIGQHIEQYRHATYNPLDYYNEALRRTPGDIRCNNAIGLWFLRNGMFEKAEGHFMRAIQTMSKYNSNPINGEPLFNLGLALKYLGRNEEAYDKFYKSTWNSSFKNAGFYHIAQLDLMNGKPDRALQHIEESLNKNYSDHKARHLKIIVLRKLNRYEEALQIARESLELDHFNFGALYEYYLLTGKSKDLDNFSHLIRGNIHNYIEYSLDYAMAGLFGDAMELMDHGIKNSESNYPIAYYYMGWFAHLAGKKETSEEWFKKARQQKPDYCFPHQIESAIALEVAICLDPSDARAYYYLGNLWYNARQYDKATKYWEKAIQYDQKFPTPFRNLALSYFNKSRNKEKALITMEKAFQLDKSDSRVFMELCQLYKLVNKDLIFRLKFFENHAELVEERDDLYLELVMLQNNLGNHQIAFDLLKRRKFKPWEGGEGKVINQYITSLIELSKECMLDGDYPKAIALLHQSRVFPVNLGEDRLFDTRDSEIDFWLGTAYRIAGNEKNASVHFIKASKGLGELGITMFYDDQPPEDLFYKGLALKALDNHDKSEEIFQNLISYGKKHINDHIKIDYFAISLPDLSIWDKDLDLHNHIHCRYITGLGLTGSGLIQDAENEYDIVLNLDKNHQGAIIHRIMIQQKSLFI